MDRNFQAAFTAMLKHEGGWADNPKDPGGATMKGVTLATFRRLVKPNATKADLRAITDEQLMVVYRRSFWDAVLGAELPDGVDYAVFDFAVNSGPSRAVKYLQRVVGVTQDGKVGPKTLAATRALPAATVINRLCDARLAYMKVIKHKTTGALLWNTFGKGWSSRVKSVRELALSMARQPAAPTPVPTPVVVVSPREEPKAVVVPVPDTTIAEQRTKGVSKTGWAAIGSIFVAILTMLSTCTGIGD